MTATAVLLNDTSRRHHHGCTRVMRLLAAGLEGEGLTITARSAARHDWERDEAFLRALTAADVVVINGEGTLHHGRAAGERLLRVATHPARRAPVALVNALWQENPADWADPLRRMDLIAARDSASAADMARASGRAVGWLPDLSLSAPAAVTPAKRAGIVVGDSVKLPARQALARAAHALPEARFVPTKTLAGRLWQMPAARALLLRAYTNTWPLRTAPFEMPPTEAEYLDMLAGAGLHITGRFHAVCLSMLTETPFLALASNASKIERLLDDAGLGQDRMLSPDALIDPPQAAPFDDRELTAIRAFRDRAEQGAASLFADIAALAKGAR